MIKRYGKLNTSEFTKGHDITAPSAEWVEMQSDKPLEGDWIAQADGTWKADNSSKRIAEIKQALQDIDTHSARAMRAIINGTATDEDRAYLAQEEAKAIELRAELATLQGV